MNTEKRSCLVKDQKLKKEVGAIFHCWTVDYEEFESGPAHHPVAIVEYEDGSVHLVYPTKLRFTDSDKYYFPKTEKGKACPG